MPSFPEPQQGRKLYMVTLKCCNRAWNWPSAIWNLAGVWHMLLSGFKYYWNDSSLILQEIPQILINLGKALFFSSLSSICLFMYFPWHSTEIPQENKMGAVEEQTILSCCTRKFHQSSSRLFFKLLASSLETDCVQVATQALWSCIQLQNTKQITLQICELSKAVNMGFSDSGSC